MSASDPLPAGWRIRLLAGTSRHDSGRLLLGGSPRRIMRLSAEGSRRLDGLIGHGVPAGAAGRADGALARRLCLAGLAATVPQPTTGDLDRIAVVVPVRDRADDLDRCLAALGGGEAVIVVDDASRSPVSVADIAARHGAQLLRRACNGGPAAARNDGVEAVRTRLPDTTAVAFVDSDVTVSRAQLAALAAHFADPAVVAVGPRVLPITPSGTPAPGAAARSPLDLGDRAGPVAPLHPVGYLPTACLLVRLAGLPEQAFDSSLRYGEDVDLVWRLSDAGGIVWFDPTVRVGHREPGRAADRLLRRYRYGGSAGALARRHRGRLAPLATGPGPLTAVVGIAAGGVGWPVAALAAALPAWRLTGRLRDAGVPAGTALSTAARIHAILLSRHAKVATQLAWPALLTLAWRRPASRPGVLALLVLDPLRRRGAARAEPMLPWTASCIAEDIAYGAGVLTGAVWHRTAEPLRPMWSRSPSGISPNRPGRRLRRRSPHRRAGTTPG